MVFESREMRLWCWGCGKPLEESERAFEIDLVSQWGMGKGLSFGRTCGVRIKC